MARKRPPTRGDRWRNAIEDAQGKLAALVEKRDDTIEKIAELVDELNNGSEMDELRDAMEQVREVQAEYQEWYDNLPENLQGNSPVSEKLEAVTDLDLELDISAIVAPLDMDLDEPQRQLDEAENADLPMGFGRD